MTTPPSGDSSEGGQPTVRDQLIAEQSDVAARITALRRDIDAIVAANALTGADDEHDPEGSSTAFERAHLSAMVEAARSQAEELEQALRRVEDGTYGRCAVCRQDIPRARLEARPTATTCVPCAHLATPR